jgi:hypothetical protein
MPIVQHLIEPSVEREIESAKQRGVEKVFPTIVMKVDGFYTVCNLGNKRTVGSDREFAFTRVKKPPVGHGYIFLSIGRSEAEVHRKTAPLSKQKRQ